MACQEGVDTLQLKFVSAEEMLPNLSQEMQSMPPKPTVASSKGSEPLTSRVSRCGKSYYQHSLTVNADSTFTHDPNDQTLTQLGEP